MRALGSGWGAAGVGSGGQRWVTIVDVKGRGPRRVILIIEREAKLDCTEIML